MANLYELTRAIEEFDLEIDEETGEVTNLDELDALELERDTKVENIALWVKNLTAEAAAIKAEVQNLTKRQKAAENKAERLKDYLMGNLAGEKFKTPKVAISYRTSEAVEITDEDLIPEEFLVIKTEYKPDKKAIKDELKAGGEVEGAELVKRTSLQIK